MNVINDKNIKECLERFFDGSTTCDEEKSLYAYFSQEKILPDVEKYRTMMMWYASGLSQYSQPTKRVAPKRRTFNLLRRITVAASVAIIATIGYSLYHTNTGENARLNELYEIYEGSYVVKNGVKCTDLTQILPEVMQNEKAAEQKFNEAVDHALKDIDDPKLRDMIKKEFMDNTI